MSKKDLNQIALIAALTVVIVAPAGLLLAWAGWPYAVIYAMGAGLAAVLGSVLTGTNGR
jgi:hypothetical protein